MSYGIMGKGNGQVQFEGTCYTMAPQIKVMAPLEVAQVLQPLPGLQKPDGVHEATWHPHRSHLQDFVEHG